MLYSRSDELYFKSERAVLWLCGQRDWKGRQMENSEYLGNSVETEGIWSSDLLAEEDCRGALLGTCLVVPLWKQ